MNQSRGAFTAQISRKRKEREDFFLPGFHKALPPFPKTTSSVRKAPSEPAWSSRLLAGYMAHEFLTNGTLLGQLFDPARAQAQARAQPVPPPEPKAKKAYAEVATLLKGDGAHIPGIVNPSQLARWVQR